jgi:hypothetical protein
MSRSLARGAMPSLRSSLADEAELIPHLSTSVPTAQPNSGRGGAHPSPSDLFFALGCKSPPSGLNTSLLLLCPWRKKGACRYLCNYLESVSHEHKSGANAFGFGGNGGDPSIYLGPNFRLCAIIVTGHGVSDMQLKRMQQPLEVKRAIENNLHQS